MPSSERSPSLPNPAVRVASLSAGATQTLLAIGAGHMLVGISHECHVPGTPDLPVLTAPCGRVETARAGAGSPFHLFADQLTALRPDVVLAGPEVGVELDGSGALRTIRLTATTIEGVLDDMLAIGRAVGLERESRTLVVGLRERLFAAGEFVNPYDDGPGLVFLQGVEPLACAGGWVVQLVERAGARHPLNATRANPNAGSAAGPQAGERVAGPARVVTIDELVEMDPARMVMCLRGVGLDAARAQAAGLADAAWWNQLRAVRERGIAIVSGSGTFHDAGPRLVDAYEWLVAWLHDLPQRMPGGIAWEPWRA